MINVGIETFDKFCGAGHCSIPVILRHTSNVKCSAGMVHRGNAGSFFLCVCVHNDTYLSLCIYTLSHLEFSLGNLGFFSF